MLIRLTLNAAVHAAAGVAVAGLAAVAYEGWRRARQNERGPGFDHAPPRDADTASETPLSPEAP